MILLYISYILYQNNIPWPHWYHLRFTFYALNLDDTLKVRKALFMFVDLFGLTRFEYETVVRFLITVKKNYREVAYHNWTHGFHVANSIYSILKSSPGVFRPLEVWLLKYIYYSLSYKKYLIQINMNLSNSIFKPFVVSVDVCWGNMSRSGP